tara:strand:+ start:349 stop:561 length:213 start_codon:yes stop_codon:yes gene_type:complete
MKKYWWIVRTDDNCGLPYDTFVKWYNIPKLIYSLYKYRNTNYWYSFTWVDMESNIGESDIFVVSKNNEKV